jgi:hypothetical protein
MAVGRCSAGVVLLGLLATMAVADDAVGSAPVAGAALAAVPRVSERMPERVRAKVDRAFELAVRHLDSLPACRELFAHLGKDGLTELRTTAYYPASPDRERTTCRGALAATHVGSPATSVCRRLEAVGDSEAAMVLLHEALHWSGLTERPGDGGAMSSTEINQMVRTACEL